jgi:Mg2+/Co2+ transporter CorB
MKEYFVYYYIHTLIILLVLLIIISGFFSGTETAMMSLNRYRLLHMMRRKNKRAKRAYVLLTRPDRLLGVVLLCNTFANILASAIATMIAVFYWGNMGVLPATLFMTIAVLLFAEITPKTLAAFYPEKLALPASGVLTILLKIFYPLIWLLNIVANNILRLLRLQVYKKTPDILSTEELKTIVNETSKKLHPSHQEMLLRILDLQHIRVEDAMLPRNEIEGIDLSHEWKENLNRIVMTNHSYLPIYREEIEHIQGMLSVKRALAALSKNELTDQKLLTIMDEVYFIPEGALLSQQLQYFQKQKKRIGLVVDEYGAIEGLLTLTDILEEVVGEFSTDFTDISNLVRPYKNGGYEVDASITVRDLNRITGWHLPTRYAKTLSGLIIDRLEFIPHVRMCLRIDDYAIEIVKMSKKTIQRVRLKLLRLHAD